MKTKKLKLRKEIIATLNKSTMSGVLGGVEIITDKNCASLKEIACFTQPCRLTEEVKCVDETKASVCGACIPRTESKCPTMFLNCATADMACKVTDFC
ncbi:class I lanthipeptide [uncultured Odoribacter sp.]|uniref:class I lanthipeptide n=1 Tax=uncultured Odoribacter sp. TaxID=876416 RepID=UPI002604BA66|nr:class I lanthipeptide [uncultured Odoribacter sp.]